MKRVFCLALTLMLTPTKPVCSADGVNFSSAPHQYSSYRQFASSACLPCHYQNIPNGTDFSALFSAMSEAQLKAYLGPILKDGNMPPDRLYREVLYIKYLGIK